MCCRSPRTLATITASKMKAKATEDIFIIQEVTGGLRTKYLLADSFNKNLNKLRKQLVLFQEAFFFLSTYIYVLPQNLRLQHRVLL